MSLYRKILKQAFSLSWKNKYLWFFGLFAALILKGEYEIIFNTSSGSQDFLAGIKNFLSTNIFTGTSLGAIKNFMLDKPGSFILSIIIILIILALLLFLLWLVVISEAALVNNSSEILTGKKNDLKEGVRSGMKNFWPILGYSVLIRFVIFLGLFLVSVPVMIGAAKLSAISSNFLYVIFFIIFLPIIISISFIIKYAIAFKVIKNSRFFDAIKEGWNLFTANWLVSLEMAFILFFITFVITLVTALLWYVLAVPSMFLAVLTSYAAPYTSFWLLYLFPRILYLIVIAIVGAMLATFQISAWTGLFIELIGKGATSKISRIFNNIVNR